MLTGPFYFFTVADEIWRAVVIYSWRFKKDMDKKKAFDSSTQWISDEQRIHETSDYGRNQRAVTDALAEQQRRVRVVHEYAKDVETAKAAAKTTSDKDRISSEYEELKQVAEHRENCLQDIAQIASLEDIFNTLSVEFAQRASSLVVDACSEVAATSSSSCPDGAETSGTSGSDGIARAAQSCILAVRNNWNWISKLVKCSDVHLKHVSDYHQFFHEAKEYGQWMPAELNKHVQNLEGMSPDENDDAALLKMLKELLAVFLHWQNKINVLFDKSRKIVPVHYRTKPLDHYVPVTSLCDYKTNEITIQEGEELTLLDNSKPQIWVVRNMHSTESQVPSVICVIPGPDTEAVAMAMRLRLQLLTTWTVCVKRIGRVVILYFGLILKDWDEDSMKKLSSMTDDDKMRTLQVLQWILDIFSKYWKDHPQFRDLLIRIERTRTIVRGDGNPSDYDSSFSREYITRMKIIEEVLTHFRKYLKQWETYKILTEASRQSDYMLLMQNWEELNFFSTEEVLRKVQFELETSSEKQKIDLTDSVQETEDTIVEETIEKVEATMESAECEEEETTSSFQTVSQTAEAEQYLHAEQEERKKFVITEEDPEGNNPDISSNGPMTSLSPRLPGDGTDYAETDVTDQSKHSPPIKSSEEYLDQRLVTRMTSTKKESRLLQLKQTFRKKLEEMPTRTNPALKNVSESTDSTKLPSPKSPKKLSKIPRFSSSETIHTVEEEKSKRTSKIPKHLFHSKSVSMDHLNANQPKEEDASLNSMSETSTSVPSLHLSEENLDRSLDYHHYSHGYKMNGSSVLIYTEETESLIGVPRKDVPKPEMCTVATQYELSDDEANITKKGRLTYSRSDIETNGQSKLEHHESKEENVCIESNTTRKTDTHTFTVVKEKVVRRKETSGAENRFGYKENAGGKKNEKGRLSYDSTDSLTTSENITDDQSMRYRGKAKLKGNKSKSHSGGSTNQSSLQEISSDEEIYYLAEEAKEPLCGLRMEQSALLLEQIARGSGCGLGMVSSTSTSTQTEQLERVQGAIAAILADPEVNDSSKGRGALCLRICKACLPLQMLMLLLLGFACLFPMSEEEYSCNLSNNFQNSLTVMLRHRDGPPPV